jgi:hypothetical protein
MRKRPIILWAPVASVFGGIARFRWNGQPAAAPRKGDYFLDEVSGVAVQARFNHADAKFIMERTHDAAVDTWTT